MTGHVTRPMPAQHPHARSGGEGPHPMKIIGTGAPEVMTARLDPSELPLWRDEVLRLIAKLDSGEEAWGTTRPFGGYHESDEEGLRVQRVEATRLLDEIAAAETS